MGGCLCKGDSVIVSREHLQQAIVRAIEEDDLASLRDIYLTFLQQPSLPYVMPALSIDDPILTVQGFELNALAYSFRLGQAEIAKYLIEKANCSLSRLSSMYSAAGKTPIQILCEYGHLDLLEYFLPMHLSGLIQEDESGLGEFESYEEMSIFLDAKQKRVRSTIASVKVSSNSQTAIQKACEYGHLEVIKFLVSYMKDQPYNEDFDVHAEDEKSGENCALISARVGEFDIMQFLFEVCHADFHKKTKRKESALQLAVLSGKREKTSKYMECVKFLIERVKVDIAYEYEETLLLCDNSELQTYLEERLRAIGIQASKLKIEEVNSISHNRAVQPISQAYLALEERVKSAGPDFKIKELFKEELESPSYLSSISPKSATPFSLLSRNITPEQV